MTAVDKPESRVPHRPAICRRVAAACLIGLGLGLLTYGFLVARGPGIQGSDFTYPWLAARALFHGIDTYSAVRTSQTPWPPTLFYPVPAAIIALPFAWLSVQVAAASFVAIGCGLLALAVSDRGMWRLWIFATPPVYRVCLSPQWAPLLMAAALWSPALGIVVAKPNLALPLLAYQQRLRSVWWAIAGGGALIAVSLVLQPAWPIHWIETLRRAPESAQYLIPILSPWGIILALAALRWRQPEARLILGMACTPQNFFFYDQFALFLIPRTSFETLTMAVISWVVFLIPVSNSIPTHGISDRSARNLPLVIAGLYLPALMMVLLRPNEGQMPWRLERAVARWPRWIRGDQGARM